MTMQLQRTNLRPATVALLAAFVALRLAGCQPAPVRTVDSEQSDSTLATPTVDDGHGDEDANHEHGDDDADHGHGDEDANHEHGDDDADHGHGDEDANHEHGDQAEHDHEEATGHEQEDENALPAGDSVTNETAETSREAAIAVAAAAEPLTVVLGSPELTAGIPGEGDLTVAEIEEWLDNPKNHRPLDVKLPLGLAAAEANIAGVEENPMTLAKIELGRQLYFDPRLSKDATISCASCHHPDEGYAKHTQFGEGIELQTGNRNSPTSYNRIVSGAQFWDCRAASLEEQAIGPIANPIEMGNSHEGCVACITGIEGYRIQFERIFEDKAVTIENVGRAIATFERALVTGPTPYDYLERVLAIESQWEDELEDLEEEDPELYADYQESKSKIADLSESARRGRELFFSEKSNCTACHAGANFTDEKYHNLGVGMEVEEPDLGRFAVTNQEIDRGAFKTPTIRNVATTAPYMHDGSQKTLEEVVEWYAKGGHANPFLSEKVKKLDLTDQDKQDLVAFMKEGLTGDFPVVEDERLP